MFQEYTPLNVDTSALLTIFMLIFLMFLFTFLCLKFRVFVVLLPIYLFSTVLGSMAFGIETPLSPWFEVLFILYITVLFAWASWDIFTGGEKRV